MRRPSNGILLLGLWMVAVLVLYVTWSPDSLAIDEIPDGQRVIVLRLPGDGVLTELVGKGSVLTLAVAKPPKPVAPSPEEVAKNKAGGASCKACSPGWPAGGRSRRTAAARDRSGGPCPGIREGLQAGKQGE
jgi:hypothetical protein